MKKVITYGTYDCLHYGHIRLLERAKALGDYLIVGVTSDAYDKERGKINGTQSVLERVEAVRKTGLADLIIIEEYEGQKIDDIIKYGVDIFTVGSDWVGKFDYLNDYCKVVYLDRTVGVSSTDIRSESKSIRIGIVGESTLTSKFRNECRYVNGVTVSGLCYEDVLEDKITAKEFDFVTSDYNELLDRSDAIYVVSHPKTRYSHTKLALLAGKHVICQSPISENVTEIEELFRIADEEGLVLMDSIKTAYSLAYQRLILLMKTGNIGDIVSVDATCTSILKYDLSDVNVLRKRWGSYNAWGPTALLPVLQLLGNNPCDFNIVSKIGNEELNFDIFTKIDFTYSNAVASIKVGNGVKSEGELIISGTKGYAYIPAPWWKTEYFEIRYEDTREVKKFYFKIDGEGIRYEIVAFIDLISSVSNLLYVSRDISRDFVKYSELINKKMFKKI
ncbi:MAG: adenylyltransferase/cytidyltransferase family protein [Acholeplasmatales bacterium]|nr:adenylyltransferase/cytidyltransferase family protein [Acholeplasmatales bacterium]